MMGQTWTRRTLVERTTDMNNNMSNGSKKNSEKICSATN
jgi:hypothetical protein